MFAKFPLSFEFYGDDIKNEKIDDVPDLTQNVETSILAEELKLSCTNVMLQCLDTESRCIFILGTMFKMDNRIAGDILDISPTKLDFTTTVPMETMIEVKEAMEDIDDLSQEFAFCKTYQSPASLKEFIQKFLDGTSYSVVRDA